MSMEEGLKPGLPTARLRRRGAILSAIGIVVIVVGMLAYDLVFRAKIGPEQHLPFSHRVHAGDKKISCFVCHGSAQYSAHAGVPETETCMLCHSSIIITYPWIAHLREHYFSNEQIVWAKVKGLPDYTYFNHSVHLRRGLDCSECHGDVKAMDRVQQMQPLNMGFCLDCHRRMNVTHDCFTCHR